MVDYWKNTVNSAGTTVTAANIDTAGSGDVCDWQAASGGSGTYDSRGGVQLAGTGTTSIMRIDVNPFTGRKTSFIRVRYVAGSAPNTGLTSVLRHRSASADSVGLQNIVTTGTIRLVNNGTTTIATGPALVQGDEYLLDLAVVLDPTTPSSTNGRAVTRVRSLTAPLTWNSGSDWGFDTGATINAGTADITHNRVGKLSSSSAYTTYPQVGPIELVQAISLPTYDAGSPLAALASFPAHSSDPSSAVDGTVVAPVATVNATLRVPIVEAESVITGGGPASATTLALPPVVTGTQSAAVVAPVATSSAVALPPTLVTSATVTAVVATSSGVAVPPTTSTTRNPTVVAPAATATGTGVAPAVFAGGSAVVLAAVAAGTAVAPVPVVSSTRHPTVVAVTTTATAAALAPTVSASGVATVIAPAATASAAARVPTVTGVRNATVQAVAAQANAQALAALVAGVANGTVVAVRATATGMARVPTVTAQSASDGVPVDRPILRLTTRNGVLQLTTTTPTLTLGD